MPRTRRRNRGGSDIGHLKQYVVRTLRVSVSPNQDPLYKPAGVVQLTDSSGISGIRQGITNIFNAFGKKGIDNVVYDECRARAIHKLVRVLLKGEQEHPTEEQKVCDLRMDIESNRQTIFAHLYGTLYVRPRSRAS